MILQKGERSPWYYWDTTGTTGQTTPSTSCISNNRSSFCNIIKIWFKPILGMENSNLPRHKLYLSCGGPNLRIQDGDHPIIAILTAILDFHYQNHGGLVKMRLRPWGHVFFYLSLQSSVCFFFPKSEHDKVYMPVYFPKFIFQWPILHGIAVILWFPMFYCSYMYNMRCR